MSQADAQGPGGPASVLVTGAAGFTAQRMAARILGADADAQVTLLCHEREIEAVQGFAQGLPPDQGSRVRMVLGAPEAIDLGMAGNDFREVAESITCIHHMYMHRHMHRTGSESARTSADALRRARVDGTRHVIELAAACPRLRRLCHWSSVHVAGKRKGVVLEEDLDAGQSFHNAFEEMQFAAEKLARSAQQRLPVTVLRPGVIVGDSRSGVIDRFDGPYYLMALIVRNATHVHLPLPGRGDAPLHMVPVDFVIDAAHALSRDERAVGKTFHLVDCNPLPARRVYELVAEHAQTALPRGFIPTGLARTLLRTPGLERLARAPRAVVDAFDHQVFFNSRHATELLLELGIRCPPFDSYVHHLLRYLREALAGRRPAEVVDDDEDPFD
ncbi:MAG TPA: SDR family oxidoreductase [Haliangium sp.]|nr:SDR family oxidoreductase [Haliangium sp.]